MEQYDWNAIVDGLNRYLRLRSIPIGMKLFETVEAMEAIPKIRRPKSRHTTDQIVAQALPHELLRGVGGSIGRQLRLDQPNLPTKAIATGPVDGHQDQQIYGVLNGLVFQGLLRIGSQTLTPRSSL